MGLFNSTANGATLSGDDLEPVAGVSLEAYARVSAGLAEYNYDTTKAVELAARRGISEVSWGEAVEGWNARIKANAAVAREFNRLYTNP